MNNNRKAQRKVVGSISHIGSQQPVRAFWCRGKVWVGLFIMVCAAPMAALAAPADTTLPTAGKVTSGDASISRNHNSLTVHQTSAQADVSWETFSIGKDAQVTFDQPSTSSLAINRVRGNDPSHILGSLKAKGQVWLINPNGVLFGQNARVNVGGLVASTLRLQKTIHQNAGKQVRFNGESAASIINKGHINADYVAFLGKSVINRGSIQTPAGITALGAGKDISLHFANDQLLGLTVTSSQLHALAANGGLIRADGGTVLLTAGAKDSLLASQVNNTGTIEAHGVAYHNGKIMLLAGAQAGKVQVSGSLDASAPKSGDGGFIETSGAHVSITPQAHITTLAANGNTGLWLLDPQDYVVAPSGGDITGSGLSSQLASNNVEIKSSDGGQGGAGNIIVNDAIQWTSTNSLTLTASNNVVVNKTIEGGGDLTLNAATANGSESANSDGVITLNQSITTTGNQTYNGKVLLGTDLVLDSGNGDVIFNGRINNLDNASPQTLEVDAGKGSVHFNDEVGLDDGRACPSPGNCAPFALGQMKVFGANVYLDDIKAYNLLVGPDPQVANPSNTTYLAGDVVTYGNQTYLGKIRLSAPAAGLNPGSVNLSTISPDANWAGTIPTGGMSNINFQSSVDGANTLTVDSNAGVSFAKETGGNTPLAGLDVTAATQISLNTNITTAGHQTYTGAVLLGGDLILDSNDGDVTFNDAINNLDNTVPRSLKIDAGQGDVYLNGKVGLDDGRVCPTPGHCAPFTLDELTLFGASVHLGDIRSYSLLVGPDPQVAHPSNIAYLAGKVVTYGNQTYRGDVRLAAPDVVDPQTHVHTPGSVELSTIGAESGWQGQTGGAGDIKLQSTMDGNNFLSINSKATLSVAKGIGQVIKLAGLDMTAATQISLNGDVHSTGDQQYHGKVLLGKDATLTSNNGDLLLDGKLDGAQAGTQKLAMDAGKQAIIKQAIGSNATLSSLDITAGSGIKLSADVTTKDKQVYHDNMLLAGDATLTTDNADIHLQGKLDGINGNNDKLALHAGTGTVKIDGKVGSATEVGGLEAKGSQVNLGSSLNLGSQGLLLTTTNGAISQQGGFSVAGATTVDAGNNDITLTNGANQLTGTVALSGDKVDLVNNAPTELGTTQVAGDLSVETNGALSQSGKIQVQGDAKFVQKSSSTGSSQDMHLASEANIFKGQVTFATGSGAAIHDLKIRNDDAVPDTLTLPSVIHGDLALYYGNAPLKRHAWPTSMEGKLDLWSPKGIYLYGAVTTGGTQTYHNKVILDGTSQNMTITSNNGGVIFKGAINESPLNAINHQLAFNAATQIKFAGDVGGVNPFASLVANANKIVLAADLTTIGDQTYNDNVVLSQDAALTSNKGNITLAKSVNGAHQLTLSALYLTSPPALPSTGVVVLHKVGNNTPLSGLKVKAQTVKLMKNISTAGDQTYTGDQTNIGTVLLGDDLVLDSGNGNITFDDAINNLVDATPSSLDIDAGSGDVSLNGLVGADTSQCNDPTCTPTSGVGAKAIGDLTIKAGGTTTLVGIDAATLQVLQVGGSGKTHLDNSSIVTLGEQTFAGQVELGNGALATFKNTGDTSHSSPDITFQSQVDGGGTLVIDAAHNVVFAKKSGSNTSLAGLDVTAAEQISLNGDVYSTGDQQYHGNMLLGTDTTLTANSGDLLLDGKLDGMQKLTLDAGKQVAIKQPLGSATALSSLDVTAASGIKLSADITTQGIQAYHGNVLLGGDATLKADNADIHLYNKVDEAGGSGDKLTLLAGSGIVWIDGKVGSVAQVGGLEVKGDLVELGSSLNLGHRGLTLTANGGMSQKGPFSVTGATILDAGNNQIVLTNSNNQFDGIITLTAGNIKLVNNAPTRFGPVKASTNLTIKTNGALSQTLAGKIQVDGDATFVQNSTTNGSSQDIHLAKAPNVFKRKVTFATGNGAAIHDLKIRNDYAAPMKLTMPSLLQGDLFIHYANAPLKQDAWSEVKGSLELQAPAGIYLHDTLDTGGSQTYDNDIFLTADTTLKSDNADIKLLGRVDNVSANQAEKLTIAAGSGDITLQQSAGLNKGALDIVHLNSTGTVSIKSLAAALLAVSGNRIHLSGNITTTGETRYDGPVILDGDTRIDANKLTFTSSLDGSNDFIANINHTARFAAAVGDNGPLASFQVTATGIMLNGDITSLAGQAYDGDVSLQADVAMTAVGAGDIRLAGSVDGNYQLALSAPGSVYVNKSLGASEKLDALSVIAPGGIKLFASVSGLQGSVTTLNDQTWKGPVYLQKGAKLDSSAGRVWFASTVDGSRVLSVTSKQASFSDDIGATDALSSLNVSADTIDLDGNVTTLGFQHYQGAVQLLKPLALKSTSTGDIQLASADGGYVLQAETAGNVILGPVGQNNALRRLQVKGALGIQLGGDITTIGAQTYSGDIQLMHNAALKTTAVGDIQLGGKIDGSHRLLVKAMDGAATFDGAIGSSHALSSFEVAASDGISLAGDVITMGNQVYHQAVTQVADATFRAASTGDIQFASTLDGNHAINILTQGQTVFGDAVGSYLPLSGFTVKAGGGTKLDGNVTTAGDQFYQGPVTLESDVLLTATAGDVSLGNAALNGGYQLAISAGGLASLAGGGNQVPLAGVDLDAAHGIRLGGDVVTNGKQIYHQDVLLEQNVTLTSNNHDVTFLGKVSDAGVLRRLLTVNAGSGEVSVADTMGQNNQLLGAVTFNGSGAVHLPEVYAASLVTGQGKAFLNGDITTLSGQHYRGDISLGDDVLMKTKANGGIHADGKIDGAHQLILSSIKTAQLDGAVGSVAALTGLTVTAPQGIQLGAGVATSGDQIYNGDVSLAGDADLRASSGKVKFSSAIDGPYALTVHAADKLIIGGDLGSHTPLSRLDLTGVKGIWLHGDINTTASQQYHSSLHFYKDVAMQSDNGGIRFHDTLDNATPTAVNLTVDAGNGDVIFNQVAGDFNGRLNSMTVQANNIVLNAGASLHAVDSINLVVDGQFHNDSGIGNDALQMALGGQWLIWSHQPTNLSLNGLDYDFKQYNAVYGQTAVLGQGSGVLYQQAPAATVGLDVADKPFLGRNVHLDTSDFTVSGLQPGDAVTAVTAGNAYFINQGAHNSKVKAEQIALSLEETATGASVFGYQHNSSAIGKVNIILLPPLPVGSRGLRTVLGNTGEDKNGHGLVVVAPKKPQVTRKGLGIAL